MAICSLCKERAEDCQCKGIREIAQELYNISNQEIKDKIRELVEVSVYHTEVVVDILEEVFSK